MFIYLAFAALSFNLVFFLMKKLSPESEIMNSFKRVGDYKKVQIISLLLVGLFIFLHFNGEYRAQWHTSPDFLSGGELYLGDGTASIRYNALIYAKENYETVIRLPEAVENADKMKLLFHHDGNGKKEPLAIGSPEREQPVTLWFPESGQWKIEVEVNAEVVSTIVVPVQEKDS